MLNKNKLSCPKLLLKSLAKLGINPGHISSCDWYHWCSWRPCDRLIVHWFACVLYFLSIVPFLFRSFLIPYNTHQFLLRSCTNSHSTNTFSENTLDHSPFLFTATHCFVLFHWSYWAKAHMACWQVLDGSISCNVGHAKSYACMQYMHAVTK